MGKHLSASKLRCYAEDGLVFPVRVLSCDETLRFRTGCDDLEKLLGGKPRTIEVRQMHLHLPFALRCRITGPVDFSLTADHVLAAGALKEASRPYS